MRAVIIEDETAAARNLQVLLQSVVPDIEICATLESIAESVQWLNTNPQPEVLFMDIHLADGDSFRIFDLVSIECPIIFTTAYDQYALKAFSVNSIDYLLKPIAQTDLERAVAKFRRLTPLERTEMRRKIDRVVDQERPRSFLVQVKDRIIPLKIEEVAYFYTRDEKVWAYTNEGRTYIINRTLDKLSAQLPSEEFFRANRQFIVARRAVRDISVWFGSRVAVNVVPEAPERIVVSKERSGEFKRWLAQG
ncbi:MAG: response regulator transcription factor [Rikenellaceae bacterium]|nr:response regulator transcription factor [Rikenellaceae bacterium]